MGGCEACPPNTAKHRQLTAKHRHEDSGIERQIRIEERRARRFSYPGIEVWGLEKTKHRSGDGRSGISAGSRDRDEWEQGSELTDHDDLQRIKDRDPRDESQRCSFRCTVGLCCFDRNSHNSIIE
jgi:hypothetical protein